MKRQLFAEEHADDLKILISADNKIQWPVRGALSKQSDEKKMFREEVACSDNVLCGMDKDRQSFCYENLEMVCRECYV